MTSFSRKLYNRDPAAAAAFHEAQRFEHRHTYRRHPTLVQFTLPPAATVSAHAPTAAAFTPAFPTASPALRGGAAHKPFGRRTQPSQAIQTACAANCGAPACRHGCTGYGK